MMVCMVFLASKPECPYKAERAVGEQLLWNVTVVNSLAPCRINAGSVCNPGTAALKAEARKNNYYKDLVGDGYLFQPLAFEIQGEADPSTEIFLSKLCKNLSICTEEPRAGSFLKQNLPGNQIAKFFIIKTCILYFLVSSCVLLLKKRKPYPF